MIDDRKNSIEREAMTQVLKSLKKSLTESGMLKEYNELQFKAIHSVFNKRLNTKVVKDIFILLVEYNISIKDFGNLYTSLKIFEDSLSTELKEKMINQLKDDN